MKAVVNGFTFLIDTIKMIFSFFSSMLEAFILVFRYLFTIVDLAFDAILTLPSWLFTFCVITIAISIGYVLIGRNVGKSD